MFAGGTTSHLILNPRTGRQRDHRGREFTGLLEIGRSVLRSAPSRFTTRNISIPPSVACFLHSSVADRLAVKSGSAWVSASSASTLPDSSMPSVVLCMNIRRFERMSSTCRTGHAIREKCHARVRAHCRTSGQRGADAAANSVCGDAVQHPVQNMTWG